MEYVVTVSQQVKKSRETSVRNGVLFRETVTRVFEVTEKKYLGYRGGKKTGEKKLVDEKREILDTVSLQKISFEELKDIRGNNNPMFILKDGEDFYYLDMRKVKFPCKKAVKDHKCANCSRISAASDENGGCAKVRDYQQSRIENYPWITKGLEIINVNGADNDAFIVDKCEHFVKMQGRTA